MIIKNPVGKKGEDIAVEFLKKKGYKILERNYRKQYAEIDIIALQQIQGQLKNETILVFVEVKTRTSNTFGTPFEAITRWKLKPLIKAAEFYKISHKNLPEQMRIDAVAVEIDEYSGEKKITHLESITE